MPLLCLGKISLASSDVIAISSAVIALLALFATFWQAWLAHRHNRLTVKPHLIWHTSKHNNKEGQEVVFSIRNLGVGPAIVKERFFTVDGHRFKPQSPTDEVQELANLIFSGQFEYFLKKYGLPGGRSAIAAGQEVVVAHLFFPGMEAKFQQRAIDTINRINFKLHYQSLYEEEAWLSADD